MKSVLRLLLRSAIFSFFVLLVPPYRTPEYTILFNKLNKDGSFDIPEADRPKYQPMFDLVKTGNAEWSA